MSKSKTNKENFDSMSKISGEFFALTYGSLVIQLFKDFEEVNLINEQLDKMGYNIGQRIIEEFLCRTDISQPKEFKDMVDITAKSGLNLFLGITADIIDWNETNTECLLVLNENPFQYFVEIPNKYKGLYYSNLLCGVLRGAFEMINIIIECNFVKDTLNGDDITAIKLKFIRDLNDNNNDYE